MSAIRHPRVLGPKKSASLYQGYGGTMAEATRIIGKYAPRKVMPFRAAAVDGVDALTAWLTENIPTAFGWDGVPITALPDRLAIIFDDTQETK